MRINIRSGSDMGLAVAELRKAAGLTQAQLAERVGIDAKYISKIESGRTVTLLDHELRIFRRLGATISIELPNHQPSRDSTADSIALSTADSFAYSIALSTTGSADDAAR
jgi:HTH-type transcriptional regulator / antitoxin HipB